VRCLLVATNDRYGYAELEALHPDSMLNDLADTDHVASLLTT
jgi:hypothetical protein